MGYKYQVLLKIGGKWLPIGTPKNDLRAAERARAKIHPPKDRLKNTMIEKK